jgi:hypothetical protein
MISFVVVAVECCLPNSKCCFDCQWIIRVECSSCKVLVDVIHSRDHSGEVGCATREEECRVLKNLDKDLG